MYLIKILWLTAAQNIDVVKLYSQLVKSEDQLTYYNSKVGTHARPSWRSLTYVYHWLSSKVDLLIAWNLESVILAAYRWISENYQDGDRIYLFGFSSGAYLARALTGMIHRRKSQRRHAWASELAETFKSTFCRSHVHIHFIGVWDTVSSVGVVRGKTLPSTTDGDHHMCYFRHALALDERRVKLYPCGGGNRLNEKLQSGDIPLLWMRKETVEADLRMKLTEVVWKMDDLSMWWLLEFALVKRSRVRVRALSFSPRTDEFTRIS
ncbi:uncharacterized protein F5891DRAFT_1258621 [Suillus fuscotomentosus]|uniref:T6SS Phospholipase effector Tle1-like catalytic domain-containing protein n=1 Tax=Suillus fuscotomentosus TaxID=1912939 RepID=A0AAD4DTQ5_9AGAM|nr:uncharacterized protein F5891DRAFT_1258621 [Suillus fuscotomentosus]KAG1893572.1 hypothetical protein F5891DRAFT_1258621 [Suillus fuscotomentosus]